MQQLWERVLAELELSLSRANFTTWFKQTAITSFADGCIVISVPNAFTQTWLKKKYHTDILKTLRQMISEEVREIVYKIELLPSGGLAVSSRPAPQKEIALENTQREPIPAVSSGPLEECGLNQKYTFNNFVVGKNNELAYAACRAIAQKLGRVYNPLFIYGGVGLGKTHLLQAIGQQVIAEDSQKRVRYLTCEQFTNDFIQMVRSGRIKEFKDNYRTADLLLIDDIQFITGKEGTQEEFFHTFNALHQMNKQIVLTSDRPPKAIPALEHRLLSRFEWGMIADIALPDLETRTAILQAKCEEMSLSLSQEILTYIATEIQHNVRELEGALNRLVAFHQLDGSAPTLESAKNILSSLTSRATRRSLTPKQVIAIVTNFYDITIENVLGASRKKKLVVPRQIIMYLLREEGQCSYPTIGQELGGRDHTTAIHAYEKISRELTFNERLRQEVMLIREKLYVS